MTFSLGFLHLGTQECCKSCRNGPFYRHAYHSFTGEGGGKLAELCDITLAIPSNVTARIQEMHILVGHIMCEIIEEDY